QPIAHLVQLLQPYAVPVLGNGDIWTAADAVRMVEQTGCAGVVVGRGCLGRPWLFGQIAAGLAGQQVPGDPHLGVVLHWLRAHTHALVAGYRQAGDPRPGFDAELTGCTEMRKHMAWYLKGYSIGSRTRAALAQVSTLDELDQLLAGIDPDQRPDDDVSQRPRGRTTSERPVTLPEGWLESRDIAEGFSMAAAESDVSGG
ncbi:MAG: tRNA dihydrouridine synthase DusB, partial [Betaproteobacteria bacterium]|nr:tRNA dihydrouridine synthase DusB [Betaproteobacteria bacterium]